MKVSEQTLVAESVKQSFKPSIKQYLVDQFVDK